MRKFILAAGVAALAISAPVAAERGGKGGGQKAQSAKVDRGGGAKARSAKVERRSQARVERRSGNADRQRFASFDRKPDRAEVKTRGRSEVRGVDRKEARAIARQNDRGFDRKEARAIEKRARDADRIVSVRGRDVVRVRDFDDDRFDRRIAGRGLIDGCPPGLFKKNPPCVPPGQAKNWVGQRVSINLRYSALPVALRDLYRDDDDFYYRYGNNGYLYKVDRDTQLVNSLLPLFGAGLGLGQVFPSTYSNYHVPSYYQPFYRDSADDYYRYANGYVYEIDRSSGLIEDMILLMGGGYGVGQMLPAGYSAYNVPYQYRDLYYDTDDYSYRYAPGAIYQVDPTTQLITSIIRAIV